MNKVLGKAPAPAGKKVDLKAQVKRSKVSLKRLATNHNETLVLV